MHTNNIPQRAVCTQLLSSSVKIRKNYLLYKSGSAKVLEYCQKPRNSG